MVELARSTFILGGQRSGKSRRAELLARQWLEVSPEHRAVMVATGQPWDEEMRERITRHQADRAQRVPGMATVEEPLALADALRRHSSAYTLIVVDCLTLWLTNVFFAEADVEAEIERLAAALGRLAGPVILVSNEVGLGIVPENALARRFRDLQGRLNRRVAAASDRVTFVAAGLPLVLKGQG